MSPATGAPPTPADSPFAAVPEVLRPALAKRGFTALTAVQTAMLAPDVDGRDLQVTSQTGSGKTVAIGFSLASVLAAHSRSSGTIALVITPTRELAVQVATELQWLFADLPHAAVDCVTGGTSVSEERHRLKHPPAVLVGTPGRLVDHLTSGALKLGGVLQLVLDEADQMLDMGFRDELEAILDQLPKERRSVFVSATFPPGVRALTKRYQRNPLHVEGTALGSANADIEHVAHVLNARDRYGALVNHLLLASDRRVLVFVRTREDTTSLADKLDGDGFRALPLSGDLTQAQRTRTLDAFKRGTIQVLVATDVAARGLDIPAVASVVHMEPPVDAAAYTHRSGRTGRAGQKGQSVVLAPRAREGYLRRLLAEAGVTPAWRPVPSADAVRLHQRNLLLAQLQVRLQAPATTGDLAAAEQLLLHNTPKEVAAALLAELGARTGRAPVEFAAPPAAPPPAVRPAARPAVHAAHSAPAADAPKGRERPHDGGEAPGGRFVQFRINWGVADGADPRRILAHVCRRGGIDSKMVGAIELDRYESSFAVAAAVAEDFARAVRRRDPRDPHLVIHQAHGVAEHFKTPRQRPGKAPFRKRS